MKPPLARTIYYVNMLWAAFPARIVNGVKFKMTTLPFNTAAAAANDNAPPTPDQRLLRAAEFGQVDKMDEALKQGAEINARHFNNDTPLIIAAREGHYDAVAFLLRRKADITLRNNFGHNALAAAIETLNGPAQQDDEKVARLLIRVKSPLNDLDFQGLSPLHRTVRYAGRLALLKTLVAAGPNILLHDGKGQTAGGYARAMKLTDAAALLTAAETKIYTPISGGHGIQLDAPAKASFTRRPKPPKPS